MSTAGNNTLNFSVSGFEPEIALWRVLQDKGQPVVSHKPAMDYWSDYGVPPHF